jgi:hypothetical protein
LFLIDDIKKLVYNTRNELNVSNEFSFMVFRRIMGWLRVSCVVLLLCHCNIGVLKKSGIRFIMLVSFMVWFLVSGILPILHPTIEVVLLKSVLILFFKLYWIIIMLL